VSRRARLPLGRFPWWQHRPPGLLIRSAREAWLRRSSVRVAWRRRFLIAEGRIGRGQSRPWHQRGTPFHRAPGFPRRRTFRWSSWWRGYWRHWLGNARYRRIIASWED
jgi:hypothetical protein